MIDMQTQEAKIIKAVNKDVYPESFQAYDFERQDAQKRVLKIT